MSLTWGKADTCDCGADAECQECGMCYDCCECDADEVEWGSDELGEEEDDRG
jgi:hypothetical protein